MKSSRATCRSRPPPMISVGCSISFNGSIGSSVKAEAMPGCIDGGIDRPGGVRIDDLPGHDGVDRLGDRREHVGRKLSFQAGP